MQNDAKNKTKGSKITPKRKPKRSKRDPNRSQRETEGCPIREAKGIEKREQNWAKIYAKRKRL